MGAILAKFRRQKSTFEVLEKLEDEITGIEAYTISTQERQKRYVGNFLVISIGLYVIGFIIFYFLFFPPTWSKRIIYSTPLLIFPIVIILLKRLVAWYFQTKLNKNSTKLKHLREEKKKVIDKVMDKETYKVAVELLNRFNDQSNGQKAQPSIGAITPYRSPNTQNSPLIHRVQPTQQRPYLTPSANNSGKGLTKQNQYQPIPQPNAWNTPTSHYRSNNNSSISTTNRFPLSQQQQQYSTQQKQHPHTPFPIINHNQKGFVEKMVDFLIGDGLSSRYGMVCKHCFEHNGMASSEEYEYSAFICAFCKKLNPARKLRPIGPKLETTERNADVIEAVQASVDSASAKSSSTSTSERDSGSDSEPSADILDQKPAENVEEESSGIRSTDQPTGEPLEETTVSPKSTEEKKND